METSIEELYNISSSNMKLSFCNFIISILILFNKGVISLEEQNQTVINAFQYLNNSSNATETKIHLVDEIRKFVSNIGGDTDENYQRIINMDLYRGIIGYLAEINETPITTLSAFKKLVLQHLSKNNIQNSGLSKNATTGLSALAIEKLSDYLWRIFVHQTTGRNSKDKQKREVQVLKRYKRHPSSTDDDDIDDYSSINDNYSPIIDDSKDFSNTAQKYFWNIDELHSINNVQSDTDNIPTSKQSAFKTQSGMFNMNKDIGKRRSDSDSGILAKIQKTNPKQLSKSKNSFTKIIEDEDLDATKITFIESQSRKTYRMISIEKAALEIFERKCHNYDYNQSLNLLKGYLLSPNENTNSQPSYYQFVEDFCKDLNLIDKYKKWSIPKHPLIDQVLFQPYLHEVDTKIMMKRFGTIFRGFKNREKAFEMYGNSFVLPTYLSMQDFLLLRYFFDLKRVTDRKNREKQLTFALLRLSLKQCERETLKNYIKLYRYEIFDIDKINSLFSVDTYTFDKITEFSSYEPSSERIYNMLKIVLEVENTAGIPNIDLVFADEKLKGRYEITPNMTFKIIHKGNSTIGIYHQFEIRMQDNRSKEEKMMDMIKKMDHLLKESHLFTYY